MLARCRRRSRRASSAGRHQVIVVETPGLRGQADRESLEQVLLHLVQNAIDASDPQAPVMLRIWRDEMNPGR